jgi:hypothetical protein
MTSLDSSSKVWSLYDLMVDLGSKYFCIRFFYLIIHMSSLLSSLLSSYLMREYSKLTLVTSFNFLGWPSYTSFIPRIINDLNHRYFQSSAALYYSRTKHWSLSTDSIWNSFLYFKQLTFYQTLYQYEYSWSHIE